MTIKDLEKQLQIPRATIRFYEKEGLITPERLDNGYREYSEEDIKIIKQIIVFRKIGISVRKCRIIMNKLRLLMKTNTYMK